MKLNKLTIITLVLLMFLSLGVVSASNDTVILDTLSSTYDDSSIIIVNDSSYSNYFNESNGNILDGQINSGDTIQIGDINDKIFTIDKNITITSLGDGYTINNGMIQLIGGSDGSSVSNLNIKINNTVYGKNSSILLEGIKIVDVSNINLVNNSVNINGTGNITGVSINGGNLIDLSNNQITTYGENKTYGLTIESSTNLALSDNEINVDGVSDAVDWSRYPDPGIYQTLALYINNCQNISINSNNIDVRVHKVKGSYDSIIGVEIAKSENVEFIYNNLSVTGNSYAYGLEVLGTSTDSSSINIKDNNIKVTGVDYGNAVKIGSYVTTSLIGNTIYAIGGDSSYGLYLENYDGGSSVYGSSNGIIVATTAGNNKTAGDGARAISLFKGDNISLFDNTMLSMGNHSIGVEFLSGTNNVVLQNNLINTAGDLSAVSLSIVACENITLINNAINTIGVSSPADWSPYPAPYGFDTTGLLIKDSSFVNLDGNNISTIYHKVLGSYDSIESLQIVSSSDVLVENNIIETFGNTYAYGLEIGGTSASPSENITISNNEIITNGNYYSGSLILNTFAQANIISNNIIANSTSASYGIYLQSGSNYNIKNNKISSITSEGNGSYDGSYGLSLFEASNNLIQDNTVVVNGIISYGLSLDSSSNNNQILENEINTTAKDLTYGTKIKDSKNNTIKSNDLNTIGSSISASYDAQWNPSFKNIGIFLTNADITTISNNTVKTSYENYSDYGTVRGIFIEKTNNVNVEDNNVNTIGKDYTYGIGANGYLNKDYSVDACDNLTIKNNNVITNSDYYSAGIDMGSPVSGEVNGNTIDTNAGSFTYGIYDASFNGKNSVNYAFNIINSKGNINYGIELYISNSTLLNNTITLVGNYSMGIGLISSENNIIVDNTIKTTGNDSATHISNPDALKEENTGIKLNSASNLNDIEYNTIITSGNYSINIASTNNAVIYNTLVANTLKGDSSVNASSNNTVRNNSGYDPELITNNLTMDYKDGSKFIATVIGTSGQPLENVTVSFTINGREYNVSTDSNGTASLAINLLPRTYDITTTWGNITNKNTITVNSWNSSKVSLVADNFTKAYRNTTQYIATLTYNGHTVAGETVCITVNGKDYWRTTDSKGQVSLNINLRARETAYDVKSTAYVYAYNATCESFVKVVKATTKLSGEPTTIVRGQYYNVNLIGTTSSEYNIPYVSGMIISVNGVSYSVSANEKGQGQLQINLLPGKYTIISAFFGDINCEASSLLLINNITVI